MSGTTENRIIANVRVSDGLERLVITPRELSNSRVLSGMISGCLSPGQVRRLAEGICVASESCAQLLDIQIDADLHWTPEAELCATNRRAVRSNHAQLQTDIDRIISDGR